MRILTFLLMVIWLSSILSGCAVNQNAACPNFPMNIPPTAKDITKGTDPQRKEVVMFLIDEQQSYVLDYYKNALQSSKWKLISEDTNTLQYRYSTCTVEILTSKTSDGFTRTIINQGLRPL